MFPLLRVCDFFGFRLCVSSREFLIFLIPSLCPFPIPLPVQGEG